jgi:hypothetical protein
MTRYMALPIVLWLSACAGGADKADVADACPVPSGGPTVHERETIEADTTWTAASGPHVIDAFVQVTSGATLTIEPCAEVRLGFDAYLDVLDGKLVAEGTEEGPIQFVRQDEAPWGYVEVMHPATASLANVVMQGGGSEAPNAGFAMLVVRGAFEGRATPMLSVRDLTLQDAYGPALWMREDAAFVEGSSGLTVARGERGDGSDARYAYPIVTGVYGLTDLPDVTLDATQTAAVLVLGDDVGGGFSGFVDDVTVRNRGVPYHVGTSELDATLRPGDPNEGTPVTLTLEAGVTLAFAELGKVELWSSEAGNAGVLRALGTEEAPVTLTSSSASPAAGAWVGLEWQDGVHPDNLVQHTVIAYAGGDCSCGGYACDLDDDNGAVLFHDAVPGGTFITDSTIRSSAGHAFVRGWTVGPVDFAGANTLEDIAGCAQTPPFDEGGSCIGACE